MRFSILASWLLASWMIASVVTAAPATSPSTAPAIESLFGGKLTFTPPAGWNLRGKADGGKTASYVLEPDAALMAITVNEQEVALDEAAAARMGQMICKKLRENIPKGGAELLTPPIVEKDDRFFLRIHDRFTKDGKICDQLQLYRVLGVELVTVAVTAFGGSPDDVKKTFEEAEQMILSVQAPGRKIAMAQANKLRGATSKPVVLTEAKLRIAQPPGWRAELSDNASGIVATFRDPDDETNLIAVSVRQLPKEARSDPKLRDLAIDEIVAGEKQQFKIEGAQVQGSTQTIRDNRFLRKTRTKYEAKDRTFEVGSRQLRVGNAVVSVSTVCLEEQVENVEKLADEVAAGIRSAGK